MYNNFFSRTSYKGACDTYYRHTCNPITFSFPFVPLAKSLADRWVHLMSLCLFRVIVTVSSNILLNKNCFTYTPTLMLIVCRSLLYIIRAAQLIEILSRSQHGQYSYCICCIFLNR